MLEDYPQEPAPARLAERQGSGHDVHTVQRHTGECSLATRFVIWSITRRHPLMSWSTASESGALCAPACHTTAFRWSSGDQKGIRIVVRPRRPLSGYRRWVGCWCKESCLLERTKEVRVIVALKEKWKPLRASSSSSW